MQFVRNYKLLVVSFLFLILFSGAVKVLATYPATPFSASDHELNPDCGPTDDNCYVDTSTGGASIWGDITGTLTDQLDLQDAFDGKQDLLPDQTGNSGKFLTTDGTNMSWADVSGSGVAYGGLVDVDHAYEILYLDNSGNLASDANFIKDPDGIELDGDSAFISVLSTSNNLISGSIAIDYANNTSYLDLQNGDGFDARFRVTNLTEDTYYQLPATKGTIGQVLTTDGSGNLSWEAGGGGSSLIGSTGVEAQTWLGDQAGANDGETFYTVFIGGSAGDTATNADFSNFIGINAGKGATNSQRSNFFGFQAGYLASEASHSNFIGENAGRSAINAPYSNFIGYESGYGSTYATYSNFIGSHAGIGAVNAKNSIFIGKNAGAADGVDNTIANSDEDCDNSIICTSILIGDNTSTGGFSNSIGLGASATNTMSDQFLVAPEYVNWQIAGVDYVMPSALGSSGSNYVLTDASGDGTLTWEDASLIVSDQTLKENITDLPTNTLDTLLNVKTVNYSLITDKNHEQKIGFLAQDLQQYYPDLVGTLSDGHLGVNYAQMAPVLVEAIRELNVKITNITDLTNEDNSFVGILRNWLASATNGIENFFSKKITTEQICVTDANGETCLNRAQIDALLGNGNQNDTQPSPEVEDSPEVSTEEVLVDEPEIMPIPEAPSVAEVTPVE